MIMENRMKSIKLYHCLLLRTLIAGLCCFLLACSDTNTENPSMTSTAFTAQIGMQAAQYAEINQLKQHGRVDKQPAGLNFYEQSWPMQNSATINVVHGDYGFQIPYALSLVGIEDTSDIEAGIYSIAINASLTPAAEIMHDNARRRMGKLFQHLLNKGWQPFINYFDPRLTGADSYRYALTNGYYHPSPTSMPMLETWMALNNQQTWALHADDVMLKVHYFRDQKRLSPDQPGDYLLRYELLSKAAFIKEHFEEKDFANWEQLWPTEAAHLHQLREEKENELTIKNYVIDDTYIDPWID